MPGEPGRRRDSLAQLAAETSVRPRQDWLAVEHAPGDRCKDRHRFRVVVPLRWSRAVCGTRQDQKGEGRRADGRADARVSSCVPPDSSGRRMYE